MAIKVEKIEKDLNIQELLVIEAELSGTSLSNEDGTKRIVKGILEEKISASVKMHLLSFLENVESIKKNFYKVREELIKKYGKEDKDESGQDVYLLGDNIEEFRKEESELLSQTFKIKVPVFNVDDIFDFKTDYVYAYSFKFLVKQDDES